MTDLDSLEAHLQSLYRLRRFGIKLGLETIARLLKGLGNPQEAFRCVHIAGTNGKGSVAAMLSSILTCAGYKVGLYTSPHLVRFNERIQINGQPVSDDLIVGAADAALKVYAQADPPTFFECATAMAFHLFAGQRVDWAVVETGMGGRFDATNVIRPEVCVITNIGLEHTQYLGKRLAQIAFEKAGIIKPGAGVVTGVRQSRPLQVIQEAAEHCGVCLLKLGRDIKAVKTAQAGTNRFTYRGVSHRWPDLEVGLAGNHQRRNAALALGAVELLLEKGAAMTPEAIRSGLCRVRWPGRLDVVSTEPLVILDGAHNPDSAQTLKRYLEKYDGGRKWTLVLGILADKNWKAMLVILADTAARVILTKPACERAADPEMLAAALREAHRCEVMVVPRVADAVSLAMESTGGHPVCVTGSLYTVGEAKAYFDGHAPCCAV